MGFRAVGRVIGGDAAARDRAVSGCSVRDGAHPNRTARTRALHVHPATGSDCGTGRCRFTG
ncbi:hypothetical protein Cci01nite_52230 [Catellatospora citrea]|uniref:Uncharacterized protein n=1 Tax=Catellatospora citrea TaxID=53366 RepID=A0A8J3KQF2_9ACTN|nr:hypothetical protein Cci01nite_52230 [Catellatospora citrea]